MSLKECCVKTFTKSGKPAGEISTVYGLESYVSGAKSDKLLVIAADVYGYSYINNQLIADYFASNGYHVLLPDLLEGEFASKTVDFTEWLSRHSIEKVSKIFNKYVSTAIDELKPKYVVGIGYCFGAKFVIQNLAEGGLLDAGAAAHPSFFTTDDFDVLTKPFLINSSADDDMFSMELRHKCEAILFKKGLKYQIDLFSNIGHGYACRGDLNDPNVEFAFNKTLADQLNWFKECQK